MFRLTGALLLAGLQLFPSILFASDPNPVRVRVLKDFDGIKKGQELRLAYEFEIDAGWHIYWRNPGESGLPTRVRIPEQAGIEASKLELPVPSRFRQPGNLVGFGYEGQMTALQSFSIADELFLSQKRVTLEGTLSWLACREVCVPGKARFQQKVKTWKGEEVEPRYAYLGVERSLSSDCAPQRASFAA